MKIPLIYIPKTRIKILLNIDKQFNSDYHIVPIGCDCHTAYSMNILGLRKVSLPFDWVGVAPLISIEWVTHNINNKFEDFLIDTKKNEDGHFISGKYCALFLHEKQLDSVESINKFKRRIDRFLKIIENENVIFLHCLYVSSIRDEKDIEQYIESVRLFLSSVNPNHSLRIYLRYDDDFSENEILADKMYSELTKLNVKTIKYVREWKTYGNWGNKALYSQLYKDLEIPLKMKFPKFYIKQYLFRKKRSDI